MGYMMGLMPYPRLREDIRYFTRYERNLVVGRLAPTGRNMEAQGNALGGIRPPIRSALKGRDRPNYWTYRSSYVGRYDPLSRPYRALVYLGRSITQGVALGYRIRPLQGRYVRTARPSGAKECSHGGSDAG